MAQNRTPAEPPKPWEVLGSFFGYFAVAKDVPSIAKTLGIQKCVPDFLKTFLLHLNPNADCWILWSFTVVAVSLLFCLLWRTSNAEQKHDEDESLQQKINELWKKYRWTLWARWVFSFGLIYIREKLLDRQAVSLYGTFRRPPDWPIEKDRSDYIDRITFTNGTGIEIQYSNDYTRIFARTHPASTMTYDPTEERPPAGKEVKLLLVASNYFPYWYMRFLAKKIFSK